MAVETQQQTILVIEDEFRIAKILQGQLGDAGYAVKTAESGSRALELLESVVPDLVILDLGLPDMNGFELCWKLRRLFDHARLPIVILTGMDQSMAQLRWQAAGADAYLMKPYDGAELLRTVRRLLPED